MRSAAVRAIDVRLGRSADGALRVSYVLSGTLDRVRVPAGKRGRSSEPLWQHTCCEIFIRRAGASAYHELNLAPPGAWAAYAFERYREGAPLADDALDPQISSEASADRLVVNAAIRLERLSPLHVHAALTVALSAVVEESGGALSYWALAHPAGKPDFHHPDAFALEFPGV